MAATAERKRHAVTTAEPAPQIMTAETEPTAEPALWVAAAVAGQIIGRHPRAVRRLAEAGHVRMHRPPGMLPRYYRPDLERFAPGAALLSDA